MPDHQKRSDHDITLPLEPLICASSDLNCHFSTVLDLLAQQTSPDAELRHLALEIQWLKSDYDRNVLTLPANWELTIMELSRGEVSDNLKRHPDIVRAAQGLIAAIKIHLNID